MTTKEINNLISRISVIETVQKSYDKKSNELDLEIKVLRQSRHEFGNEIHKLIQLTKDLQENCKSINLSVNNLWKSIDSLNRNKYMIVGGVITIIGASGIILYLVRLIAQLKGLL